MFSLTPEDLNGKILDCAGGPASFNAEANASKAQVVSCDPLYRFTAGEIRERIVATYETMISNARAAREKFVWRDIGSPDRLGEVRMAAMQRFLEDFPPELEEGRYRAGELLSLPFEDREFDLALCSHFLFTYIDQLPAGFHVAAIEEMCRVAGEARVFPLLESYRGPSPFVGPVTDALRANGYRVEIHRVPYEFQRGGNELMSVTRTRSS